jgi:hypothetical protein
MRAELFFLVLFVIYCLEAGLFLVLAPWNGGWDRLAFQVPLDALRELLLAPGFRGAVTGFGLVHLVWGLHDLRALLTGRRRARQRALRPVAPPAVEPARPVELLADRGRGAAGEERGAGGERAAGPVAPARLRDAG